MELLELTTPDAIDYLLTLPPRGQYRRRLKGEISLQPKTKRRGRCSCGRCVRCRDEQKWNERFEARFGEEMAAYYNGPQVISKSALSGF